MIGILDPDVAFAFNMECAEILLIDDQERENRLYEALGLQAVTQSLTGGQRTAPLNSGDQGW